MRLNIHLKLKTVHRQFDTTHTCHMTLFPCKTISNVWAPEQHNAFCYIWKCVLWNLFWHFSLTWITKVIMISELLYMNLIPILYKMDHFEALSTQNICKTSCLLSINEKHIRIRSHSSALPPLQFCCNCHLAHQILIFLFIAIKSQELPANILLLLNVMTKM